MPIAQRVAILVSAVEGGKEGAKGKADHSSAVDEIDAIMGDRLTLIDPKLFSRQ